MSDERFTGHTIYMGGLKRNEYFQFYENGMRISEEEVLKTLNSQSGAILGYDKLVFDLRKENERLKQQLLYEGDDVCGICRHEYLVPSEDYFIAKCKKGHRECSKKDIKYCEDFELIQVDFEDLIKRMDKELGE